MNQRCTASRPRSGRGARTLAQLLLAMVVGLLLAPGLVAVPARAADPEPVVTTPLSVHLSRLTPATIPVKGRLTLAGTVTNTSEDTWSSVNVYPFLSSTPMTTRDELAAAADSDPETEVGSRLVEQNEFVAVGDLPPGASVTFRISLKVVDLIGDEISGAEGVYWIGVHALGQNAAGGERTTLGRARTFIPLVRGAANTSVALVIPVRERVRRTSEGRVLGTTAWAQNLAPSGRLGRLGSFIASAGTRSATLLVDPAVLEAVEDLKNDNPPLSLGTVPEETEPTESPSPTSRSVNRMEPVDRANASAWLDRVVGAARTHTTLGLGYADPDAAALARRRPAMLGLATRLAAQSFTAFEIPAVPTTAPTDGWFDEDLLAELPEESLVLVSDHGAPRERTRWRTSERQDLVFSDEQVSSGGPAPTTSTDALALRQRIVADAALRIGEPSSAPLVVQLPDDWDPGEGWQLADFFNALDQPWLDLVGLSPTSDVTTPTFTAALAYPSSARRAEVPAPNVSTSRTLIQTTTVLANLLRSENTVAHDLAGTALSAVSYHAREDELVARQQVLAANTRMRSTLGEVQVIGTDFVTLSGGSGTIAVTLVNGLQQPVVVGIKPVGLPRAVSIDATDPVEMAPGERTVLRLQADATGVGVTQVVLSPVTTDGTQLGTPLVFQLRTSEVGKLIWGVLGAGGLLLVVMITRRVLRGLREHRWRPE